MSTPRRWLLWCVLTLLIAVATLLIGRLILDREPRPFEYHEMQKG